MSGDNGLTTPIERHVPGPGSAETTTQTIEFDYRAGPKPAGTYHRIYDELREAAPAYRVDVLDGWWMLTRSDQIREAYQRADLFSSRSVVSSKSNPPYRWIPEMIDPPEHTRWRQLLAPIFAPAAIKKLEGRVRTRCVELIDGFVNRGSCDFLNDFARRYPTSIFLELMGLPVDELETFMAWEDMMMHSTVSSAATDARRAEGMRAVTSYFARVVAERRRDPKDDIVSFLTLAQIDGQPVSDEDVQSVCLLLFIAGLDTVAMQLCWSFLHLATHPVDRARIVEDPSLIPLASEEFLRAFAHVTPARQVTQDVDFHGCPMKEGDMVFLPLCSATRDPRQFDRPDEVIIDRNPNPHIGFGAGPHRCLGSYLARQELHIAFEEWHKRIPDYRVAQGAELSEHGGALGLNALPLEWTEPAGKDDEEAPGHGLVSVTS